MVGSSRVWGHEARSKRDSPYTEGDPGFATLIHLASSGLWETAQYEPETRPSGAYMPVRRETIKNENRIQCPEVVNGEKKYSAG